LSNKIKSRKEEIKRNIIERKSEAVAQMQLEPINVLNKDFEKLMEIYNQARQSLTFQMEMLKEALKQYCGYDVINNITSRIKSPESIINKMKKKNLEINYQNLIENINDIAGVRVICTFKDDVEQVKKIIRRMQTIEILNEKDYIKNPKKSGYSAYHIIVELPMKYEGQDIYVKAEIQICTMAMNFWSTAEHKIKYKKRGKLSKIDSKKMEMYAKIINKIEEKIRKIYRKKLKV